MSSVVHLILFLTLSATFFDSSVSDNPDVVEVLRNHSNILIKFPEYMVRTKDLQKRIEHMEPKLDFLTEYRAHTKNLLGDVKELTDISFTYREKLDTFLSYKNKTDKLEDEVIQLLESVKTYEGSLKTLDVFKRRTNLLELHTTHIIDILKNNSIETDSLFNKIDSLNTSCETKYHDISAKVEKFNIIENKQSETTWKLDKLKVEFESDKNSTVHSIKSVLDKCTMENTEIKTRLEKLDTVTKTHDQTATKLNKLMSEFEMQKKATTDSIESLRNTVSAEQKEVKTELQKVNPLTSTQKEMADKLDKLASAVDEVTKQQQTLQQNFRELSSQLQELIKIQTAPTTTSTTPAPDRAPLVIRRRVHARGNNILVTV